MSVIVLAKKTTLFLVAAVVFYILLFVTNTRNQFRDIKENSWTHNANQIAYNKFRQVVPTNSHLYVEKLEKLRGGVLTKCRDVHSPTVKHLNTPSIRPPLAWINIGMVLVNLNPQPSTLLQDLRSKFSLQTRNLNIMLDYIF
ncbi:uncharacterized protein LOC111699267 [Eurytemora carolleeae]|uniref:uncharacterized protein LOC111699267 n=1 Tax=Eurytemora carolleeae TaxID=1294199 RepID=UPI000C75E12D|nr:uncharacterized protein LOC111699267 [Eurytemora carolleeae]|eukprot:XP_023325656.1 uncharacterized protein LOC111699267 [Eurytemora affinis]